MSKAAWQFQESDRDAVCRGEMCPACLTEDAVVSIGAVPDGINVNEQFRCTTCNEEWEGY